MNKLEMKQIVELIRRLRMQEREDEMMYKISDGLDQLNETEQAALGMRFIAGENYSTVAQVLNMSETDSKYLAHSALLHLKRRVFG